MSRGQTKPSPKQRAYNGRSSKDEAAWLHETIECMTSLVESVHFADASDANEAAFAATRTALTQLEFRSTAFAVPSSDGLEFHLSLCDPPSSRPELNSELAFQVAKGRFGWALRQGRPVLLSANEQGRTLLLHSLATRSRVIGVFMGLFDDPDPVVPAAYRKLMSLAFYHFASVIESRQLSDQVRIGEELLTKRNLETETMLRGAQDLLASEHQQSTRMLEGLGRELQTSASAISSMASGLMDGKPPGAERDTAQGIFESAGRVGAALSDLSTWCRLDSGSFEFGRRDFDPTELVLEVQRSLDADATSKGIVLTSRVDSELPNLLRATATHSGRSWPHSRKQQWPPVRAARSVSASMPCRRAGAPR